MKRTGTGRMEALDGLRGWAVALVFLVHFCGSFALYRRGVNFDAVDDPRALVPGNLLLYWMFYSHHGVQIFFAISGFVIAHSFAGNRTLADYLRFLGFRVLRIYPAFLVSLALALALFAYFNGAASIRAITVAQNLLFLNGAFALGIPGYNFVTWSLFYEFVFYLAFPLLYLVALRSTGDPRWTAPLAWLAFLAALAFSSFREWFLFLPFFFGAWAGLLDDATRGRIAVRLPDVVLIGAYAVTTTLATFQVPLARFGEGGLTWPAAAPVTIGALAVVSTLVIIRVSHGTGLIHSVLTSAPVLGLGRISFSFFLVHAIVIQAVFGLTPREQHGSLASAALLAVACFAVSCASAALLYRIAEKPYYRLRRFAAQAAQARRAVRSAGKLR